jgi:thioredoxin reductase (NADPH)
VVIGGGNSATEESLFLADYVESVTLLVRDDRLKASQIIQDKIFRHPKIDVWFNWEVDEFQGKGASLQSIKIHQNITGEEKLLTPAGVFVFIGLTPNTGFLANSNIVIDAWGFVVTGHDLVHDGQLLPGFGGREPAFLETSIPGVFAAGDVRAGSTKQVASAAGEGAAVALQIREYLKHV